MSSAANFPLQESTRVNKENEREEPYEKFSQVADNACLQNTTLDDVASFLKVEQEKSPNFKRLNAILLERLKETESKLRSLESEKEEWERKFIQNNYQEQNEELSEKLREAEKQKKLVEEELEQVQLRVEIHLKELEKAREDFDNISNLFEEQLEENSTLQEEKSFILKQVRQLKDVKKQLEMSVEQLSNQLSSTSDENEKLKQKIQQYQMAFEVRDEALQQISAELREKRLKVNQLQVDCAEKEDKVLKLEEAKENFEKNNSKLEQLVKEKQQFLCEFHNFLSEFETSVGQFIQEEEKAQVSSLDPSLETLSVESYSETNETAEWRDLAKLKKLVELRNERFSVMQQEISELEKKLKLLSDTTKSQKEESKKTVMMSRLLTAIRGLFSFWLFPTKRNPTSMSLSYEKVVERAESSCSTHS
ncbi:hypothetical protein Gasu_52180 isoform 1 [Galdieria sulphuraria]|uniref:Uncharacterized protein n=1 Tax=Galdieria sulphuraria TaxID=130081 RepID=M2XV04_GALSU|nr:hypothetical protein Gasu_52180 isoform 1 [Galdieria sulphuraria]EME27239.1 hypothetical protein isoform 1 [Galdieria sulphuraria]|eukprot:XP_005703759.1 hypothetical protein isoform 1 [Galdieria sulphuraria]